MFSAKNKQVLICIINDNRREFFLYVIWGVSFRNGMESLKMKDNTLYKWILYKSFYTRVMVERLFHKHKINI